MEKVLENKVGEENGQKIETKKLTVEEWMEIIDARLKSIEEKLSVRGTGRGPASTRSMTEADAERVMVGDLSTKSIKECAKELGLSYGQVYSARGGYTFKTQYAAKQKLDEAKKTEVKK